jgi:N4-gp56 family major capsid protein
MSVVQNYGDITPRTAGYVVKDLLKRGMPYLCIEKFGQVYVIPNNATKVAKFRRYFLSGSTGSAGSGSGAFYIPLATTPLVEGVTPTGRKLANQDYDATLVQYGDYITITDVIHDTHEDPILQQAIETLGEQAAQTIETIRYNVLKAGTVVGYANGSARTDVNTAVTLDAQRTATAALDRQNAKMFTKIVKSTPSFNVQALEAAYVGLGHTDIKTDVRKMTGYINPKNYGSETPWENEVGNVEQVRYLTSTLFAPFADGGGAKGAMRSTTGTSADVYPILYLARDAFGIVPLKGKDALTPMVVNPKPAPGDALGQRGTVGWKAMTTCLILQDAFMYRLEVAATA